MQLIGMLDSPYVRRVAISLEVLGIPFEHFPISVFDEFEKFQGINPVVKAPTLVCDDGSFMMDSSIILQFIDATNKEGSLWKPSYYQQEFRAVSLALAACDKSVQIIYERHLRPKENQYEPWMERVTGQVFSALDNLEAEIQSCPDVFSGELNQAIITSVVAWTFIQSMLANVVPASKYSHLSELAEKVERLAPFKKYPPVGPGVNS